ncbi:MAG: RecX family transcriptional regulator [Myxococcales bacterium]|nr:RecX family transcriptional regulator [Myxococcales bacterium]
MDSSPRRRRAPRRITAPYLQRVTAHYLERYASSRANLKRLLMRRVHRSAAHHDDDPADGEVLVDAELDRLEGLGLIDDDAYAADRARSLNRRGASARKIRATLASKGVAGWRIDAALESLAGEGTDPEWRAALTYARKRRIGPYRRAPVDDDGRRKELGRMARAGFSFDLAKRVLDATEEDLAP